MATSATPTARDRPPEEAGEDTSFARGLRILLTVSDRGTIRADELSTLLDTPLSTVYRYLRTLAEFGFVERSGAEYRLGPRLLIGGANVTAAALVEAADPVLRMLTAETGETALLMRRVGLTAVCLHATEPVSALRVAIERGAILPLHIEPVPLVLLAFAPPEVVDQLLAESRAGHREPLDEADLRATLVGIVSTGMARSLGEDGSGIVTLAVPVMREDGIAAAVGVTGPLGRCSRIWQTRSARLLAEAAAHLSASLAVRSP